MSLLVMYKSTVSFKMMGVNNATPANKMVDRDAIKKLSLYLFAKLMSLKKISISKAFPVLFAKP